MAVKSNAQIFRKDKGTILACKGSRDAVSDEITLRDEILELKRQMMILRRTNEQNLIKFRKYEDEAKRKDRQIEQLMDPRKNADISKILSTKGAAILMNLKDQNNSLVQMVLAKDMQIRRLASEIKMSKLYGSSRKADTHRAEIIRLRSLLIKSQEILRENIDLQQRQKYSVYDADGNSVLDVSLSSNQTSPREVDELKFTIQTLETHIKYSNDLLAKKNQEITYLKEEMNKIKKISSRCASCSNEFAKEVSRCHFQPLNNFLNGPPLSCLWHNGDKESRRLHSADVLAGNNTTITNKSNLELFGKTITVMDTRPIPYSAPSTFSRCASENVSTPRPNPVLILEEKVENFSGEKENANDAVIAGDNTASEKVETGETNRGKACPGKRAKEKWKAAFTKYKLHRRQSLSRNMTCTQDQRRRKIIRHGSKTKKKTGTADKETHEFEMTGGDSGKNHNRREDDSKPSSFARDLRGCEKTEKEIVSARESSPGKLAGNENSARESRKPEETLVKEFRFIRSDSPAPESNEKDSPVNNSKDGRIQNGSGISYAGDRISIKGKKKLDFESIRFPDDVSRDGEEKTKAKSRDRKALENEIPDLSSSPFSPEIRNRSRHSDSSARWQGKESESDDGSLSEMCPRSFDSSFDSETGYPVTREPRLVRVQVEINALPSAKNEESTHLHDAKTVESVTESICNYDDDDDVITR